MFTDRITAGRELAHQLRSYRHQSGVVLAVPRGGVPVAYMVARELDWPLNVILTKKIGHPENKEYAIGAASMTDSFVLPHAGVSSEYITETVTRIRRRLSEMQRKFTGNKAQEPITGKTVIVVDDGIATGNTLLATIHMLRKQAPAVIVMAVPVASKEACLKLGKVVDKMICLHIPEVFWGVGAFYENFEQVTDEEVVKYLEAAEKVK